MLDKETFRKGFYRLVDIASNQPIGGLEVTVSAQFLAMVKAYIWPMYQDPDGDQGPGRFCGHPCQIEEYSDRALARLRTPERRLPHLRVTLNARGHVLVISQTA